MVRNRASAKAGGARFERETADNLAKWVDDRIDRRVKTGSADKGDIAGLRVHNQKVVVECKDYGGQIKAAEWTGEAEDERLNDGALAGIVVAKRRGYTNPMKQWVLMEMGEFIALLNGNRKHLEEV
jgi:hypothetical protein